MVNAALQLKAAQSDVAEKAVILERLEMDSRKEKAWDIANDDGLEARARIK